MTEVGLAERSGGERRTLLFAGAVLVVVLALFVGSSLVLRAEHERRASNLETGLLRERSEFTRTWNVERQARGETCPGAPVEIPTDLAHLRRMARCATVLPPESPEFAARPRFEWLSLLQSVGALLPAIEQQAPEACVLDALDVLVVLGTRGAGDAVDVVWTTPTVERAISSALGCLKRRHDEGVLTTASRRARRLCGRRAYAAGVAEWHYLESAYEARAFFRRRALWPAWWQSKDVRSLTSGSRLLGLWEGSLENARAARRLASTDYPKLATALPVLVDSAVHAARDFGSFGATELARYRFIESEQRARAEVHALVCILHASPETCPATCNDPYSGAPLVAKVETSTKSVYAVGKNKRDEGGDGDDLGVRLPIVAQ
jgi:hypothetical protein